MVDDMELLGKTYIQGGSRITIPKNVRKELDLSPGDMVAFWKDGDRVIFGPAEAKERTT